MYAAERCIQKPHGTDTMSIEACQALVDKIIASPYTARKFPDRQPALKRKGIKVYRTHGGGHASHGWSGPEIYLGVWARQPVVVIHEVAHHLAGSYHADGAHGHAFANAMLVLVRFFIDTETGDTLKASYKQHRVRTRPKVKRIMTDAQRAAAIANLRPAPASTAPAIPTWQPTAGDQLHQCIECRRLLPDTKYPTTRTPGVREARCRQCRDAAR